MYMVVKDTWQVTARMPRHAFDSIINGLIAQKIKIFSFAAETFEKKKGSKIYVFDFSTSTEGLE